MTHDERMFLLGELARFESYGDTARAEEIIKQLGGYVPRCRRCNVPMTGGTCRGCDAIPYEKQHWKH